MYKYMKHILFKYYIIYQHYVTQYKLGKLMSPAQEFSFNRSYSKPCETQRNCGGIKDYLRFAQVN